MGEIFRVNSAPFYLQVDEHWAGSAQDGGQRGVQRRDRRTGARPGGAARPGQRNSPFRQESGVPFAS
jgi:hypothetical protein